MSSYHITNGNGQLLAIGTGAELTFVSHLVPVQQHSAVLRLLATVALSSTPKAIEFPVATTSQSLDIAATRALLFCYRPGEGCDKWCDRAIASGWDVQPIFVVPE